MPTGPRSSSHSNTKAKNKDPLKIVFGGYGAPGLSPVFSRKNLDKRVFLVVSYAPSLDYFMKGGERIMQILEAGQAQVCIRRVRPLHAC